MDAASSFLSIILIRIADAAIRLLDNDAERHAMRKRAYLYSRGTTWQSTAQAYMASFQRARVERMQRPRPLCRMSSRRSRQAGCPCWIRLTYPT